MKHINPEIKCGYLGKGKCELIKIKCNGLDCPKECPHPFDEDGIGIDPKDREITTIMKIQESISKEKIKQDNI